MMDDQLRSIIASGEGYHTEFKQTIDKSLVEEACAFANAGGGKIILGVADDGSVAGIDSGNVMRSRIQDSLSQLQPALDVDVAVVSNLIVIQVPEGVEKPYACPRGFFMRVGANSQKLARNEIINFFQKEGVSASMS